MHRGRKRLVTALSGLALVAGIGLMSVTPAQAAPSVDEVRAKVERLYHEAEQASERYNDAQIRLAELKRELEALRADQNRQNGEFGVVQDQLQDTIIRQYEGQTLSAVGQVVVSEDPKAFLARLSAMDAFNDLQANMFNQFATESKALTIRREATARRVEQVAKLEKQLANEKQTIDAKYAEATALLNQLTGGDRAAATRSAYVSPPKNVKVSGRAGIAVSFALSQVGKAYAYGGTGPNAYDCSGLTMVSWGRAGVGLPHSSSAQFGSGPHVSASALRPGDLVFYYSPISHVAIYIGNGLIVHAAHPGAGVRVAGLYSMPYVGAVRPG